MHVKRIRAISNDQALNSYFTITIIQQPVPQHVAAIAQDEAFQWPNVLPQTHSLWFACDFLV